MPELLQDQAVELGVLDVGQKLAELEDEVRLLFGQLNFVDVDESQQRELEDTLDTLLKVRDLIAIANSLYPYEIQ